MRLTNIPLKLVATQQKCEAQYQFTHFSSPDCGKGEQTRYRLCIDGRYGGTQCPKPQETEKQTCESNSGM